ncbi:hypothetical protein AB0C33_36890 [Nonomuraea sp. NPDC048881]
MTFGVKLDKESSDHETEGALVELGADVGEELAGCAGENHGGPPGEAG